MTARSARTPLRFRRRHAILAVAAAFLLTLLAAPAAFAATAYTGGVDDYPAYIPNDHTVVAIHFSASGLTPGQAYYVKMRFSPAAAPAGDLNRGFTWNGTSKTWVQERSDWTAFPQVTAVNDGTGNGVITGSTGWVFAKFADTTRSGTYHILASLSTGGSGNTFNGNIDAPVTIMNMQTDAVWLHNGIATGKTAAKRAEVDQYPLPVSSPPPPTVVGMSKTEANTIDEDADGVVDNEAAFGTGSFRMSAPIGQSVIVQLNNAIWPASSIGVTYATPDVDIALGGAEVSPPTAVTDLTPTWNETTADLSWTAATDNTAVTAYQVYRILNPASTAPYTGLPVKIATVTAPTTTYTDPALPNLGYQVSYVVRAVDAAGNVGPRAMVTDSALPANVTSFAGVAHDASVHLSWTNPIEAGFTGVQIRRSTTAAPATPADGDFVTSITNGTATCDDGSLINGTSYFYSIWAQGARGRWSAVSSTGALVPAVPPVSSVYAFPGNGHIFIGWTNPSGITEVVVRRNEASGTPAFPATHTDGDLVTDVTSPSAGVTGFQDNGRDNNTNYAYSIFTKNAANEWSAAAHVGPVAPDATAIPPVTGASAVAGDACVTLTWINPTNLTYFDHVWIGRSETGPVTTFGDPDTTFVDTTTGTTVTDSAVVNGHTYYYGIFALAPSGDYSVVASAGPVTPKFASAITLRATAAIVNYQTATTLTGQITVNGANPTAAVQYEIWSGTSATSLRRTGLVWSTATGGILLTSRPLNKVYYQVRVVAGSDYQQSPFSAVISVTPRVALSTPSTPSIVTHNSYFTLSGTLKPRHSVGTRSVKLLYERPVSGHWVVQNASTWMSVANYSSYSKYSGRVRLWAAGKWRVRAYMAADSQHAATYSAYRYITAR